MSNIRTQPLSETFRIDPTAKRRLARVAAIIFVDYLDSSPEWNFEVFRGSLTFKDNNAPNRVVKLTIDRNKMICKQTTADPFIHLDHPVLIGINVEQMYSLSGEKRIVRNGLHHQFGSGYVDPRNPSNDTWALQPIYSHSYDLIFLNSGLCNLVFTTEHQSFEEIVLAKLN